MKKLLLLSVFAMASTLSAATITLNCPSFVGTGTSGTGSERCSPGFSLPSGVTSADITSIAVTTVFDFQFNPLISSTASASYQFTFPTGGPVNGSITNSSRPDVKSTTLCSGAGCANYLTDFTINDSWTGSAAVTGATFDKVLTLTYADPGGVPEPATIGLVGMALIGLGLSRRRS